MNWTWTDEGTFTTTRDDGATLTARVVTDEDPDLSWMDEGEDPSDYYVNGLVLSASLPDGRPYGSTSLWGITTHQSDSLRTVRRYFENVADDIAPDLERLERLAILLLGR
ncbi:MAG TPA: hypothetical protein VJP59_07950 [Gemmatimonadota bacterium]|nr:hypothetical protein [Gemmatimonadota bacterium]